MELVPYHSRRFGLSPARVKMLPSVIAIRTFVMENIVPRAQENDATVVITRKVDLWDLPDGVNIIKYTNS